jgi:hypothetical protein
MKVNIFMRKTKQPKAPPLAEPYRDHRWAIQQLVGERPTNLFYAESARLPNYMAGKRLPLIITFYDVSAPKGPDVLEQLLACTRHHGDTIITRHHGDGNPVSQFTFINSRITKLTMPKLDYKSPEICRITLKIDYDKVVYGKPLEGEASPLFR